MRKNIIYKNIYMLKLLLNVVTAGIEAALVSGNIIEYFSSSLDLPHKSIISMIKSIRMRRAGHVPRMGEKINAYSILVGKQEGKKPLARPRPRWVTVLKYILER
jgi:hypothetical protein